MGSHMLLGNSSKTVHLLSEYYHQLYTLAGNMDLIWASLQKTDTDLSRLLSLAVSNPNVLDGFMQELTNLTDALINRNYDRAGLIYDHHSPESGCLQLLSGPITLNTLQSPCCRQPRTLPHRTQTYSLKRKAVLHYD